jgi:predicted nucleic acid-binding protein
VPGLSDVGGYLDTNIVIHSLTNDPLSDECRRFLVALERGEVTARLDVSVLHELTYSIPRYRKQSSRTDIVGLLRWIVGFEGIVCDRALFIETLVRWGRSESLGFVDAHLISLASRDSAAIYTKNAKHFAGYGVDVPDPLPGMRAK